MQSWVYYTHWARGIILTEFQSVLNGEVRGKGTHRISGTGGSYDGFMAEVSKNGLGKDLSDL